MITNNTYYKGDIFISQAKPSISDDATAVDQDFLHILNKYEEDCLIQCLGYNLYAEFSNNIDLQEDTLINSGSSAKWRWLMNGHDYIDSNGDSKKWGGIRKKMPLSSDCYNDSFLAYFVYVAYERRDYITNTTVGHVKEKVKNAEVVAPTHKVVNAWREFYKLVQGEQCKPALYNKAGLLGVDYYNQDKVISLYQFINDMNALDELNFVDFKPKAWGNMNQFGL